MLQRIQTVYLMLSVLIMGALYLWFPVIMDKDGTVIIDRGEPLVFGLVMFSIILAVFSIVSFKNRKKQFVFYRSLTLSGEALVSEKGIGIFLPLISIVFLVLANKAIKKDEDLVKSADRLR